MKAKSVSQIIEGVLPKLQLFPSTNKKKNNNNKNTKTAWKLIKFFTFFFYIIFYFKTWHLNKIQYFTLTIKVKWQYTPPKKH